MQTLTLFLNVCDVSVQNIVVYVSLLPFFAGSVVFLTRATHALEKCNLFHNRKQLSFFVYNIKMAGHLSDSHTVWPLTSE